MDTLLNQDALSCAYKVAHLLTVWHDKDPHGPIVQEVTRNGLRVTVTIVVEREERDQKLALQKG